MLLCGFSSITKNIPNVSLDFTSFSKFPVLLTSDWVRDLSDYFVLNNLTTFCCVCITESNRHHSFDSLVSQQNSTQQLSQQVIKSAFWLKTTFLWLAFFLWENPFSYFFRDIVLWNSRYFRRLACTFPIFNPYISKYNQRTGTLYISPLLSCISIVDITLLINEVILPRFFSKL